MDNYILLLTSRDNTIRSRRCEQPGGILVNAAAILEAATTNAQSIVCISVTPHNQSPAMRWRRPADPELAARVELLLQNQGTSSVTLNKSAALLFDGAPPEEIPARIAALRRYDKPIVCNKDDKVGDQAAEAARLSVENGASHGLMLKRVNQYEPFAFKGPKDDAVFYRKLTELTLPDR